MKTLKYKHVIFDMDCTLTESRSEIHKKMIEALQHLIRKGVHIVVITGADLTQIAKQMKGAPSEILYLSQNGNFCKYWENKLSADKKDLILQHIHFIKKAYSTMFLEVDHDDLIQDRGCQITFSMVGHHASLEVKKAFDKGGNKRDAILKAFPFNESDLLVRIGGTTSLDYTLKNGTKGKNLERLFAREGWLPEDCIYIGDAIYPNGNDGTVIGVVPNLMQVAGPNDTLKIIKKICR